MAKDFLLEIGVEELPARFLGPALKQLRELTAKALQENRLDYQEIICGGTPRRMAVFVQGLAEKQAPLLQEVKGPAVKVAFNDQGEPTKAAQGFAKSQGVAVEDLITKTLGPVEYVFALKKDEGQNALSILPQIAPALIEGLHFPKPMRWGHLEMRFARPVRWLACLYGSDVVDFQMAGLASDRLTMGHRFLSGGQITIPSATDYFAIMQQSFVMVDVEKRRELIRQLAQQAAAKAGGVADIEEDLLDEVTNLVEYPTALCGSFDADYLSMPEPVLITPMREHQRYFPVRDQNNALLPLFIAISNNGDANIDTVRAGNEKVLRARLADAAFFWQEDLKKPLRDYVPGLEKVVFQESLGSVYAKVQRLTALAQYIAGALSLPVREIDTVTKAANLTKADLTTNMVYEFPELQGLMGREYALRGGETKEVAQAIYEHYLPRFAGDDLPQTKAGQVLSLADKIDTLVGCFGLGIAPTGSQDPYALRRQALGVCHIIMDQNLILSLKEVFEQAWRGYDSNVFKLTLEQVKADLTEFFRQRMRVLLMDKGLPYDTVDAVLSAGLDDLSGTWLRAQALEKLRHNPAFDSLLTAFTRAHNLSKKTDLMQIHPHLLETVAEQELYRIYQVIAKAVPLKIKERDYTVALTLIASLQQPVDRFFDEVMVMVEDMPTRDNRLALLKNIAQLTGSVADLSKIVTSNK